MQQNQFSGYISEQDGYATLTFEIGTGQRVLNSQVEKTYTGGPYGTFLPCSKTERAGGVLLTYTLARKESLARILRQQDAYGPEMCSSMLLTTLEYLCHAIIACRGTDIYTDNISYQPDHIFWDAIEGRPYFVYFPLETGNQTGPAFLNLLYYLFGSMYTWDAMLSGYVQQYLAHGHFVPEEFLAASAGWRASYAAQGGKKKKKQKAQPAAQPYQGYPPQGGYQGAPMQAAPVQPAPMMQQPAPPPPPPAPMRQAPAPPPAPYPPPAPQPGPQPAQQPVPPVQPQQGQPGVQMAALAAAPLQATPPVPPPFAPRPENERTVFNVENAAMAEFAEEAPTVFMGAASAEPPQLLLSVSYNGQARQHALSVFPCVLGRSQRRANLILEDPEISNVHLEVSQSIDKSSFMLEDRDSKNGTLLNDAPLPAGQPHKVNAGDVVKLGQTTITIDIG